MSVNYDIADRMANMGDVKRSELTKAGAFSTSRSAALLGDNSEPKPKKSDNVVEAEMKAQESESRFAPVFEQLHEAVDAACEACQKLVDGVQSEKEQDNKLASVLDDLEAVVQNIRDSRQDIMSEIAPAQDAPEPLKS